MKLTRLVSVFLVVILVALSGGCSTMSPDDAKPHSSSGGGY